MKSRPERLTQTKILNKFWNSLGKIKNCKVTWKDRFIQNFIHYNADYKILDISFKSQNTLFNLMNNALHFLNKSPCSKTESIKK